MHRQPLKKSQSENEGIKGSRNWTASQLQRKRQLDRESQRIARERTRNRILHLENLVKSFEAGDDDRVRGLLKKVEEQEVEIERLRDVIRGINRLIEGTNVNACPADIVTKSDTAGVNSLPTVENNDSESSAEQHAHSANTVATPTYMLDFPMDESIILEDLAISNLPDYRPNQRSQSIAQLAASIAGERCLEGRFWYLAGGVLSHLLQIRDTGLLFSARDDEDIAIRAVFEGWTAVTKRYHLDSGWQWLKELDERMYYHLPAPSRLIHMRNTRLVFLNQVCPDVNLQEQIPSFFEPRPCGAHIRCDPLAEHFPWPGFRRRLLYSPLKFATNKFMDSLRYHVDFIWNQNAHGLYTRSLTDGRYRYSDSLVRRMMDIRCYAAKREFFHDFPELRADIPCSTVSINSLIPVAIEENTAILDRDIISSDSEEE